MDLKNFSAVDRPQDGVFFVERALLWTVAITATLALLLLIAWALFSLEPKVEPEGFSQNDVDEALTSPLGCDAVVSQRGAGEPWTSRCYVRGRQ